MKIVTAHCPIQPEEVKYNQIENGMAEVWIRKNITKATIPESTENETEYVYEEVYFRTNASEDDVNANVDKYWQLGQEWEMAVPKTQDEKIEELENQLVIAKAELDQARTDNDLAIAELTMVMAAMMGGEANV